MLPFMFVSSKSWDEKQLAAFELRNGTDDIKCALTVA